MALPSSLTPKEYRGGDGFWFDSRPADPAGGGGGVHHKACSTALVSPSAVLEPITPHLKFPWEIQGLNLLPRPLSLFTREQGASGGACVGTCFGTCLQQTFVSLRATPFWVPFWFKPSAAGWGRGVNPAPLKLTVTGA